MHNDVVLFETWKPLFYTQAAEGKIKWLANQFDCPVQKNALH